MPINELVRLVRSAEVKAVELVKDALSRIEASNPELNAFVAVDGDAALSSAADIDAAVARGESVGPLAGIPIGVKDTEDAVGFITTFGSMLHADDRPAIDDCELVVRLKRAGAIVVGKTNTSEFAFAADTSNDVFGTTESLLGGGRTAGGSSGGSAVAVAAGMVPLATGSDGGGSIRLPAAVSGLPGFKPSLGRVPHGDLMAPDWPTLSTRGLICADVGSTALAYDAVVGPYPRDVRSLPAAAASWHGTLRAGGPRLPRRLGWSADLGYARTNPDIAQICMAALDEVADSFDVDIVDVPPLASEPPAPDWLTIAATGTMQRVSEVYGTERWDLIGSGTRHVLSRFGRSSAQRLHAAEDTCHRLAGRLAEIFEAVDLLFCPVAANEPPDHASARDGAWVELTYPFNMTRSPAGCVPVGRTRSGAAVSIQVVGPQHADVEVLCAMQAIATTFALPPTPARRPQPRL